MKKTLSFLLALAICLGLTAPAMAATVRAMTDEEAAKYVDFGPNIAVNNLQDVYVAENLILDMGSSGRMTETGYFAINKDVVFKLGNLGTPGSGSFLVMYMAPFERGTDGAYRMIGQYYLRGGSQSGWAMNSSSRVDEIKVTSGNIVSIGIPTASLPEDTLYQFIIMAYISDEIICKNFYFKVNEAKVAAAISSQAPTSVDSFTDVAAASPYRDAIDWAVKQEITTGTTTTTFSPNSTCTTAQILTFIWRAQGSPAPAGSASFSNLDLSAYYAKAALWAKEKGLVSGSTFNANAACTRGTVAEYLWKLAGSPSSGSSGFSDVSSSASYAKAVAWAVEHGVTAGTSATTFSPDQTCTRGQIVTFLYRSIGGHPLPSVPAAGSEEEQLCARLIELVNQERAKVGLAPLATMPSLTAAAQIRAPELAIEPSHYRPDGSLGLTAMDEAGVPSASMPGENLAFGFSTAEAALNWWMNSPIHRMNILMPQYTHIGVAYDNGNWVQLFASF